MLCNINGLDQLNPSATSGSSFLQSIPSISTGTRSPCSVTASSMASTTVYEIARLDLQGLETPPSASITDVRPLSSYNWIEAPDTTPTIAIPGSPALWSAPRVSRRLEKDSGLIYIAQNAARHPESPLEPLFRALYIAHPSFDIRSTDVVTDRNNIRKLLSFIDPSSTRNGLEAFTMNIEVVKDTAIFCRTETKTQEYIGPQEFRGFGHEFEKAYTMAQISGSTGHHRIISYRFGDLSFIVRHETDGYVETDTGTSSSKAKDHAEESLSGMLGALSLSPANTSPSTLPAGSKLMIKQEGQVVPLESTLEIKTRVIHKHLEIQEVAPQLWISQTPKLVRAYHRNGTFQWPVVEDVATAVKDWEKHKQKDLQKLAALIRKIITFAKECKGKAVLKYDVVGDKLVVYKVEMKEMLPTDLYSKWDGRNHGAESDAQNDDIQRPRIAQTMPESMSTKRNMDGDLKARIKIGDVDYSVHVSKVPYLASFVQLQKFAHPETTELIHEAIPLFDVALKGVESGYRQCFRSLSMETSQYRTLFETYKFLNVDVLSGLSIDEVIANLKVGKADYDPEERQPIPGNKGLARDTAFQLLYLILYAQFGDKTKDSMKLYNAVMFVVSHPGTFKYRTKRVVRVAYEERFTLTTKQKARLDQWEKDESADYAADATTEEDTDDYLDSDYSF